MKNKKIISLLLALMMMLSVVPFYASAADPIALTEANVVSYPTADGTIYAGQKIGDYITLKGGEVRYDANANGTLDEAEVVPGRFEIIDEDKETVITTKGKIITIKFVPEDTVTYTEIAIDKWSSNISISGAGRPITITEYPTVPEIESGAKLSTITITGGSVVDTETQEAVAIRLWHWKSTSTTVSESGYYPALLYFTDTTNYKPTTVNLYVRIIGDTSEVKLATVIEELPVITNNPIVGDYWSTVELTGGKVVDEINDFDVAGKFTITNTGIINTAGLRKVNIAFTPDDESYSPSTATITITVEKGNFAFLDENGAETVPEITVPFGATMGDIESALKVLTMNTTENIYFSFADGVKNTDNAATGTYNVIVRSYEDNSSYNETTLPVKVIVEQKELILNGAYSAQTKVLVFSTKEGIAPRGTFDVYVDGALVKSGVAYGEKVAYDAFTASGVHTIKIVYIPTENDGYKIADYETETQINLARNITAGENTGTITAKINGLNGHISGDSLIVCGDTIELSTIGGEAFLGWKIADTSGNTVDLGIADLKAADIAFAMPDYDIVVTAEYEKQADNNSGGGFDIDGIFGGLDLDELTQGDSEWVIINIIRNLIAKFKSFLQQLIETFQSIGD